MTLFIRDGIPHLISPIIWDCRQNKYTLLLSFLLLSHIKSIEIKTTYSTCVYIWHKKTLDFSKMLYASKLKFVPLIESGWKFLLLFKNLVIMEIFDWFIVEHTPCIGPPHWGLVNRAVQEKRNNIWLKEMLLCKLKGL